MSSKKLRFFLASVIAVAATTGAVGCKDQEKCDEALRVTRDAIAKEDMAAARQWRDHAWKMCEDPATISNLDKEILDKETAIRKRAEEEAKKIADAAQTRMKKAGQIWKKFDKLDEEKQTMRQLRRHEDKAAQMKEGLPPEYQKQIEEYNEKQMERREEYVEKLEKKKKK